jgi:hypothetical protein
MDNIVSLDEARKNKEKEVLKKLPQTVADYLELRSLQVKSIQDSRALVKEFEENKLCLSKKSQLTGPQLDLYLSYKMGVMVAVDNLRFNDERMKEVYPAAKFPEFE